jgi:hypothetical protein
MNKFWLAALVLGAASLTAHAASEPPPPCKKGDKTCEPHRVPKIHNAHLQGKPDAKPHEKKAPPAPKSAPHQGQEAHSKPVDGKKPPLKKPLPPPAKEHNEEQDD